MKRYRLIETYDSMYMIQRRKLFGWLDIGYTKEATEAECMRMFEIWKTQNYKLAYGGKIKRIVAAYL